MIEEFKYLHESVKRISSLTLTKNDIKIFHEGILERLKKYKVINSKYTIIADTRRTSVTDPNGIDFLKFKSSINALIIEFSASKNVEMEFYLSTYEKNAEIEGFRSHYRIRCNDEDILVLIEDFLDNFFKKRKNYNSIFHEDAALVSTSLSIVPAYLIYKKFNLPFYVFLGLMMIMPFYVFTKFFRWLFPYTYFTEENPYKNKVRYGLVTIILGATASGAYYILSQLL